MMLFEIAFLHGPVSIHRRRVEYLWSILRIYTPFTIIISFISLIIAFVIETLILYHNTYLCIHILIELPVIIGVKLQVCC